MGVAGPFHALGQGCILIKLMMRGAPPIFSLYFFVVPCTPGSMNSLFSDLFRKCGGVFLEVCETISRGIWKVLGGDIEENYPKKIRNKSGKSF